MYPQTICGVSTDRGNRLFGRRDCILDGWQIIPSLCWKRDRLQPSGFDSADGPILAHDGVCGSEMGWRHASRCRCGLRHSSRDIPLVDQEIES